MTTDNSVSHCREGHYGGHAFGMAILTNVRADGTAERTYFEARSRVDTDHGNRRGFMRQPWDIRGRRLEVFNTHIAPDPSVDRHQTGQLAVAALNHDSGPIGITGDFNTPHGPGIDALDVMYRHFREVDQDDNAITFKDKKIDYIFIGHLHENGASVKTVAKTTSDHETLVSSLRF